MFYNQSRVTFTLSWQIVFRTYNPPSSLFTVVDSLKQQHESSKPMLQQNKLQRRFYSSKIGRTFNKICANSLEL